MRAVRAVAILGLLALLAAAGSAAGKGRHHQWRFPLRGQHDFGNLSDTGFGKKRPDGSHHTGQDILADCGTPLIAPHLSTVRSEGYSDGYGFYLVLQGRGTRFDFVYGHMKGRARVNLKSTVKAGRRVGSVGRTGSESGVCHLHFELWSGRWFGGGHRIDPLPHLRKWDKFSGGPVTVSKRDRAAYAESLPD
jgi:murein DD-endopeptidase MepM/ murein hydrolase activator NlpD